MKKYILIKFVNKKLYDIFKLRKMFRKIRMASARLKKKIPTIRGGSRHDRLYGRLANSLPQSLKKELDTSIG